MASTIVWTVTAIVWICGAVFTHGVGWRNAYRRDRDTFWSPAGLLIIAAMWPFLLASWLLGSDDEDHYQ